MAIGNLPILPAATGLFNLTGLTRSNSKSIISFKQYTLIEAEINVKIIANNFVISEKLQSVISPEIKGANMTNKDFIHCFGRAVKNSELRL
jgi:hypothetical protein